MTRQEKDGPDYEFFAFEEANSSSSAIFSNGLFLVSGRRVVDTVPITMKAAHPIDAMKNRVGFLSNEGP